MTYSAEYGASQDAGGEDMADGQSDSASFRLTDLPGMGNIAEILDETELNKIGYRVCEEYGIDCDSREDKVREWDASGKAFKLQRTPKTYPFQNASNVKSPVLLEAAIQFSSRATPALVHDGRVAKGKVEGDDPMGQKAAMAERVANYLNYQILVKNTVWQAQTEKGLLQAPIYGNFFKKVWRDPIKGTCSDLVSCYQFVINACYQDIETAPRYSYEFDLYPHQVEERKRDGRWLDIDLPYTGGYDDKQGDQPKPEYDGNDPSTPHCFIEQYRREDLDDDGYEEPYFVTVHKSSKKVVRMVTAFDLQDIWQKTPQGLVRADQVPPEMRELFPIARVDRTPDNTYINYEFIPDPTGHAYGIGFGALLNDISETINTTINQILDAGNLQNSGGGWIGREFRLKSGAMRQEPGLWQQVPFGGDDIRKAMVPMVHPGPSPVLFNMLGLLQEWTKNITSTSEVLSGEATPNQPATTTLALIEQGLKVFTGIIGRMLRALGQELKAYYALNARYANEEQQRYAMVGDTPAYIARSDFNTDACDVVPVADSTVVTDAQAMARAEMIMQAALTPIGQQTMDPMEVMRRYLQAARIPVEGLIKGPDPQQQQMQMQAAMLQLQELQGKVEKLFAEANKANAQAQTEGNDLPIKHAELEMEREGHQMEMQGKVMDIQLQREKHVIEMEQRQDEHEMDMQFKQQDQNLQHRFKAADAALSLDLKEKQGEAALKQQDAMAKQKAKQSKANGESRRV